MNLLSSLGLPSIRTSPFHRPFKLITRTFGSLVPQVLNLCRVCDSLHFKPLSHLPLEQQDFISRRLSRVRELPQYGYYFHHRDLSMFKRGVNDRKCDLCSMILSIVDSSKSLNHKADESAPAANDSTRTQQIWLATNSLSKEGTWTPEHDQFIYVMRDNVIHEQALWLFDIPDEISDCIDVSTSEATLVEEEYETMQRAIKLAKWWIRRCRESHSSCRLPHHIPAWPTRIIDVGPPDGSGEPRLVLTENTWSNKRNECYATLSHCWGKEPLMTTTIGTLSERLMGIPMSSLPKTFRDAVTVCRGIGIRYLWVDALCIIQDSLEDWLKEANSMGAVYKEAAFCISAVGSSDGNGGLFYPESRPGLEGIPRTLCLTNLRFPPSPSSSNHLSRPVYLGLRHGTIVKGPLRTRAWVLQEETLSRRQLEFTGAGLHWTCQTVRANAANLFGSSFGRNDFWDQFDDAVHEDGHFLRLFDAEGKKERALYEFWYRSVVEDYSRREITFDSDRVVALGAMTAHLDKALFYGMWRSTGIEYLAGLWSTDILRGLLWTTAHDACTRIRAPVRYVAPSWSWLSVRGPVSYAEAFRRWDEQRPCVQIVSAKVEATGNKLSPSGFAGGELKLRGKICSFTYRHRARICSTPYQGLMSINNQQDWGVDDHENIVGFPTLDDLRDMPDNDKLLAVPLVRRPATEEQPEDLFCLVLKPALPCSTFKGGFIRVGSMVVFKIGLFDDMEIVDLTIF
ncbi:heterokaryon incompatibility protein-domain-containing protein [Bisporella sp. PMI_857]|nr:heterokaryon incompatibility protein-domain-containing protein [Bisporella sp. PMI_857]